MSVNNITSRKAELFNWMTILFSNTLGTALGDFFADDSGLGYEGAAVAFAGALALMAIAYFYTRLSRPLGATVGDLLTKPTSMVD